MLLKSCVWLAFVFCAILAACAPQTGIVVEWTTATEINTAGFNLYRSERVEGPYARINDLLIPASFDQVRGGKYWYEDRDALSGKAYYYKLEDVELDGVTTQHGPIQVRAVPNSGINATILLTSAGVLVGASLLGLIKYQKRKIHKLGQSRSAL